MAKAKKSNPETPKEKTAKTPTPKSTGKSVKAEATPSKKTAAKTPSAKTAGTATATKGTGTTSAQKKKTEEKTPAAKNTPAKKTAATAKTAKATTASKATAPAKQSPPPQAAAPAKTPQRQKPEKPEDPMRLVREWDWAEEDGRELPLEYGDTKVVLLTRDPEWIFVYWEMSSATRKKFGLERGAHGKQLCLRLHELPRSNSKAMAPVDTPINDYTSSWYLRVPNQHSRYRVELGFFDSRGDFKVVSTSNDLELPVMNISEETDVQFAEINDEIYSQIVHLSGGLHIRERLGSDEFLRSLQQRVFESLAQGPMSSAGLSSGSMYGLSSFGLSSGALSSGSFSSAIFPGLPQAGGEGALQRPKDKDRDFWLEVGVDVIVYGATEPDAKVKFMGQDIRLTPDGTFRVRMVFPDTTIEFPIEAVSNDGKHKRAVKPVVKRSTEGDPRKPA